MSQSVVVQKTLAARSRASLSLLLLMPVGIVAALSPVPFRAGSWGAFAFENVALALFLVGVVCRWWATLYIGGVKGKHLIVDGPYSLCRNPLYLGSFLMALSAAVSLQSGLFTLASLLVAALYLAITVPGEEQRLAQKYGAAFDAYCDRVPRFLPRRCSGPRSGGTITVLVDGLKAECVRSARWGLIPFAFHVLLQLRSEPWWPEMFTLP